jgi:large subunit ribosomal protein L7/L12
MADETTVDAAAPVAETPASAAEVKKEEAAPAAAPKVEEKKEAPAKFKDLIHSVEKMTVLELHELVKALESHWGVSAAAVAAAPAAGGAAAGEEKTSFNAHLTDSGAAKVQVIKAVKDALGLGLKEAKDLVDATPTVLKEGMKKEDADKLKAAVEAAGGKVELK